MSEVDSWRGGYVPTCRDDVVSSQLRPGQAFVERAASAPHLPSASTGDCGKSLLWHHQKCVLDEPSRRVRRRRDAYWRRVSPKLTGFDGISDGTKQLEVRCSPHGYRVCRSSEFSSGSEGTTQPVVAVSSLVTSGGAQAAIGKGRRAGEAPHDVFGST